MSPAVSTKPARFGSSKPKADIYTVMLAIALFAILTACLLLFFELQSYERDIKAQSAPRAWFERGSDAAFAYSAQSHSSVHRFSVRSPATMLEIDSPLA